MPAERVPPLAVRRRLAFAAVVRARRTALGLSQEQLARRAGCDRQSIVRLETATRSPSLDRIFMLADALDVRLGELLHDLDHPDPPKDEHGR